MVNNNKSRRKTKEALPVLSDRLFEDNDTRIHLVSGGMEMIETSDVNILKKWISDQKNERRLSISLKPSESTKGFSRIFLGTKSSAIAFYFGDQALPDDLVKLVQNADIKFFSYGLVKRYVKNRFFQQFGITLGANFFFLTRNDSKINWKSGNIEKLSGPVKDKMSNHKAVSSQWSSLCLHEKNVQSVVAELNLALDAGQLM